MKPFDSEILLAHFIGGQVEAHKMYVTWFSDIKQTAELESQPRYALPSHGQPYPQGREKRKWQNAMGILQKALFLTKAIGHFLEEVALIVALNNRW